MAKPSLNVAGETLVKLILAFVTCLAIVGAVTCIFKSVAADGKVDYCRIEYHNSMSLVPTYAVIGHRDWRSDVVLAASTSFDEAQARMKEMCK